MVQVVEEHRNERDHEYSRTEVGDRKHKSTKTCEFRCIGNDFQSHVSIRVSNTYILRKFFHINLKSRNQLYKCSDFYYKWCWFSSVLIMNVHDLDRLSTLRKFKNNQIFFVKGFANQSQL